MDILDIDEALKDDSFICLEDKTHDDVSNILQQWKSNNCLLPSQYQQEQAYKLNSRTFTRPRRKSAQNLEAHFMNSAIANSPQTPSELQARGQHAEPILNLEIGGLVTTMHKSFLQDTSPPSSICSSMEVSIDRMNNSLITSADFSNINFLQSTQSLDFNDPFNGEVFNLANKSTNDGYTLSDMIRDRKALESLTLSGDGTLIKDSHIAQIDDISLALSKTASGYSTMDNSTESMDEHGRIATTFIDNKKNYSNVANAMNGKCSNIMHQTMLLSDEVISDTTFDLVESSLCGDSVVEDDKQLPINDTNNTNEMSIHLPNETFKKPWRMDETMCLPTKPNTTFECKQLTPDARGSNRCETPENILNITTGRKFYESTPQTTNAHQGTQQYTPSTIKLADDVNISPIVGSKEQLQATRVLNETFGQEIAANVHTNPNSKTYSGTLPRLESLELIEDIENPNETFNKSEMQTEKRLQQSAADIQMQNVLDLAHAEEELLASNNDQEFEDMLEEFSKVELNAEHIKMKKSLETIKRRFNRDPCAKLYTTDIIQNESNEVCTDESQKSKETTEPLCGSMRDLSEQQRSYIKNSSNQSTFSAPSELQKRSLLSSKEQNECSNYGLSASTASTSSAMNSTGGGSSSGERLLSRRSRLYDNINLSALSAHSPSRLLGASFTVQKEERLDSGACASEANETEHKTNMTTNEHNVEQQHIVGGKTEEVSHAEDTQTNTNKMNTNTGQTLYKLAEKRERDRDRFKTMKIVKDRNAYDGVNVPCIDDDAVSATLNSDCNAAAVATSEANVHTNCAEAVLVFNNNKSEINTENGTQKISKINPNFLTYKKPKDKQQSTINNLPEITPPYNEENITQQECNERKEAPAPAYVNEARARSRSRPRYISGLQKFSVVKATSAGDLERATTMKSQNSTSNTTLNASKEQNFAAVAPKYGRVAQPLKTSNAELKSPLGAKSKSFHNLSSNFGFSAAGTSGLPAPRALGSGLRKPATVSSDAITTATQKEGSQLRLANGSQQSAEENVFKVPRLVSGIRAPGAKRAGLVRPSSGYYSLNLMAKVANTLQTNDLDSDGGRHSPTDSMSSASSRGSLHNGGTNNTPATANTNANGNAAAASVASSTAAKTLLPSTLTKITTGATGIPKPSGLRQPTNVKRSGLPKPAANVVRR